MKIVWTLLLSCWFTNVAAARPKAAAPSRPQAAVNYQGYAREVLFSVPVGYKSQHIGVQWQPREAPIGIGVHGFRVAANGRIFLGDAVNGAVKVFDAKGRYLLRTQGVLDMLRTIAVNRAGEIFALWGSDYDTVSKFSPSGKLLWRAEQRQVLSKATDHFSPLLYVAPKGGIAVAVDRYVGGEGERGRLALIDGKGKFERMIQADFIGENGRAYLFGCSSELPPLSGFIAISDFLGKKITSYPLRSGPRERALFSGTVKDSYGGIGRAYLSPSGTLYTVSEIVLPTRVEVRPNKESHGYSSGLYSVIISYTPSGQPLASLRCLAPPFSDFDGSVTMDAKNNVYTIEYAPNVVRVVRYRLKL